MRLLFLTNIPTPYRTTFYNELNTCIKDSGGEMMVLYCSTSEPNRQWEFIESENNYPFNILKGYHPSFRSYFPHINFSVISEIKKFAPSRIIVAGGWNIPTMIIATLFSGVSRNDKFFWSESHRDSIGNRSYLVNFFRRLFYSKFGGFCVPNFKSQDFIQKDLGIKGRFILLPNSIDDSFFSKKSVSSKSDIRAFFKLPKDSFLITQVSQINDRKGVFELLEAIKSISVLELQRRFHFVLVGEGEGLNDLNEFVKKNNLGSFVTFLGNRNKQEIKNILQGSDVFILCSKRDPNPLAPIEAAFSSLPLILSTNVGNSSDLIIDGRNGYIFEKVDPPSILDSLLKLDSLSDNELSEFCTQSFNIATENFSCVNICRSLIKQLAE